MGVPNVKMNDEMKVGSVLCVSQGADFFVRDVVTNLLKIFGDFVCYLIFGFFLARLSCQGG